MQEPDEGTEEPAKRRKGGGGGAWRAFMHIKMKQAKFTRETVSALAQEYKNLSSGEMEKYRRIGASATMNHQQGAATFPSWSSRAKRARSGHASETTQATQEKEAACTKVFANYAESASLCNESLEAVLALQTTEADGDSLKLVLRALGREARKQRKQRKEAQEEITKDVAKLFSTSPAALSSRRHLADLPTCTWRHVPFPAPAALATTEPANVESASSEKSISAAALSSAWQRRHLGVKHKDWEDGQGAPEAPLTRCHRVHFCCCRGRGKVLAKIHRLIQGHISMVSGETEFQDLLVNGGVVVQLQGLPRQAPASRAADVPQEEAPMLPAATHFALIALQYLSPWRPTLAVMTGEWAAAELEKLVVMQRVLENGSTVDEPAPLPENAFHWRQQLSCGVTAAGAPDMATIWEWLDSCINLGQSWWLKLWVCCKRDTPVPQVHNIIWTVPHK